ncbi:hypothetical protein QNM99_25370 [Pseudomonas sp. PCH446]
MTRNQASIFTVQGGISRLGVVGGLTNGHAFVGKPLKIKPCSGRFSGWQGL